MTTKHTPAPWVADDSGNVFGPGGRIVASCYGVAGARAENMANAAMLAAALDLADALEAILDAGQLSGGALAGAIEDAEAALAKAGR